MRTPSRRGSPTTTLASAAESASTTAPDKAARNDRLSDRGAFLSGLRRHLANDFLDVQIELRRPRAGVGPEHRGIERVGLCHEAHRVAYDRRVRPKQGRRRRGAREGNDVLATQVLEQVTRATTDELQRALGQEPRDDDRSYDPLGEIRGRRRRLDDRRHPREQCGRELLEHSPDREIEGIDVDRRTLERQTDMLADETSGLRQGLDAAVEVNMSVRQLAPPRLA